MIHTIMQARHSIEQYKEVSVIASRIRYRTASQQMLNKLKRTVKWISQKHTLSRSSSLYANSNELRRSIENELQEKVIYIGNLSSGTDQRTKLLTTKNGRYTLKVPKATGDLALIFRQTYAFRALQGKLPIPTIRLATKLYVLEDYICGIGLNRTSLDEAEEKHVFTQLGRCLKTIHQTKTEGFGVIGIDARGQFPTQRDYARDLIDSSLPRLAELSLLSSREFDLLIKYLNKYDSNLTSVQPVMLHNDCHDSNIKVWNGSISGVLDFSDLASGPRALDFAKLFITHYGSRRFSYILDAYGKVDLKEIEYYAVLHMIRIIPYLARRNAQRQVSHRLEILRGVIH